jgi:hypothetical protein
MDTRGEIVTRWPTDDNTGKTMLKEHELHHCRNDMLFKTQDYAVRECCLPSRSFSDACMQPSMDWYTR